jgi:hypothetical protein
MLLIVEKIFAKNYLITNRPATPLSKDMRNHGGFFYFGAV